MENFELVETAVPEPGAEEVLLRSKYLSVDPYMRGLMSEGGAWDVGEPMGASVVGEVVESDHPRFEPGDMATGDLLWAEYATASGDELQPIDPDLAPVSTALGVLGISGSTAYFGMRDVGDPKPDDTVVVSGAAGAVGSVAGQIAKLEGSRVVGIAGSERKVQWLTDDLGFDDAIDYKSADDLSAAVAEACPEGVDLYYDNVDGEVTDAVFEHLNEHARVVACGQVALYNATEVPIGPRKLPTITQKRVRVEGFSINDYMTEIQDATEQLAQWIQQGDVQYEETITEGFENMPDAFLGLFEGANIGKQLVKVEG
ncbi:NADP-dependent oxidoreductase [Haloferax sp. ATB1]|uniref:NADP-dependent oxidoreductase n=1 Tax=Haloferax sp. ATB1 TaxID=1508454 RepID=UPI001F52251E